MITVVKNIASNDAIYEEGLSLFLRAPLTLCVSDYVVSPAPPGGWPTFTTLLFRYDHNHDEMWLKQLQVFQ